MNRRPPPLILRIRRDDELFIVMYRDDELFIVMYRDERDLPAVVATLCRWTEDPLLSFTIFDGVRLALCAGVLATYESAMEPAVQLIRIA